MERTCENCKYKSKSEDEVPCKNCKQNATDNFKPMTNGDYIRAMNDEDLANFLCYSNFELCKDCKKRKKLCTEYNIIRCYEKWLKEPRKVEE